MKSIRISQFGGPEVLKLQEVPDPRPGPGQVVVEVRAVGVNPVETYIRAGRYGERAFPFTPGGDCSGVVEAVGEGVTSVEAGQRVYTAGTISGSYAQKALCDQKHVQVLPDNITFQQGAALGVPYGTAYRALMQRAAARPGETVLVHGASGGVGIAAVQIARAAGMTVIGSAGSERGRKLVLEQGAHHVVDHGQAGYADQVLVLTGGRGVDVILEMLANVNLDRDLSMIAKFGRIVVIGNRGRIEIDPRATMAKDAEIRGMLLYNATDAELRSIHAALRAGLENGTLNPVIAGEMPLADAAKAHELVMSPGARGKIVLIP